MKNIHSIRMEKQFVLDYNDAHEEIDIDSNIGFQTADRSRIPLCRQDKVRPSDGEGEPPELLLHLPSEALRQESLLLDARTPLQRGEGALQRPLHSRGDRLLVQEVPRTPFQLLLPGDHDI